MTVCPAGEVLGQPPRFEGDEPAPNSEARPRIVAVGRPFGEVVERKVAQVPSMCWVGEGVGAGEVRRGDLEDFSTAPKKKKRGFRMWYFKIAAPLSVTLRVFLACLLLREHENFIESYYQEKRNLNAL